MEASLSNFLQPIVTPWYEAIKFPAETQHQLLLKLTSEYSKTNYGANHFSSEIHDVEDFRKQLPKMSYPQLEPFLAVVKKGEFSTILSEPRTSFD